MNLNRIVRHLAGLLGATALVLYLVFPPLSMAQASLTTGAITGIVTDPTGAVIPKATVIASNVDTGASRSATTASSGSYTIPLLDPGQYKVHVKASGFESELHGPVTVAIARYSDLECKV